VVSIISLQGQRFFEVLKGCLRQACRADEDEGSSFKRGQGSEDEEGGQVRGESCANAASAEQNGYNLADLQYDKSTYAHLAELNQVLPRS